ncbi:MAG: glycerophosphoryl diester phosphodiesterase [Halioglobus sp.]|jgi:glycerophosphoryl diester phosphodiesterase
MKNIIFIITATFFFTAKCMAQTDEPMSRIQSISNHLRNPTGEYILVVSHRGDWRYAPENSVEAVQRCIDLGVDIVEIDVRITKDGHLIAIHDETVDRTTNGSGKVSDFTLVEIKQLKLKNACGIKGSRFTIPTLEEIMLVAKDKIMINLDKTEGETVQEAYLILKKTQTVDHAIFKANSSMNEMREKYGELMDSIIFMPKLWYENERVAQHLEEYESDINPFVYETLFDSEDATTFKLLPQLNRNGDSFLAICLWDALCAGYTDEKAVVEGAEESYGWLISHGADGIMTDRPELLLDYLRAKGLHE